MFATFLGMRSIKPPIPVFKQLLPQALIVAFHFAFVGALVVIKIRDQFKILISRAIKLSKRGASTFSRFKVLMLPSAGRK